MAEPVLDAVCQSRGVVGLHHNAEVKGAHGIEQGTGPS
jgi:hypothetical protein